MKLIKKNFQRLVSINPGRGINRSDNPKVYEKNIYYEEYQELNNYQNITNFLETQGILLQLISRFTAQNVFKRKQKEARFIPVKILDSINFISLNLNIPITIRMLADRVNQNVDYFSRLFEDYTGQRPSVFINEKKIERAQYLIATSQEKYSGIADATGFESLSHFSKTFKKITGLSPREYKRQIYFDV